MFPVHFYTFSSTIKLNVDLEMFILTLILSRFILFAVPPDRPIIYESKRKEKAKNVEAYNEGSDVLLICEVTGGKCWFPNQIFSDICWQIINTRLKKHFAHAFTSMRTIWIQIYSNLYLVASPSKTEFS